MSKKTNFAVVVPCYNEEEAIPAFEKELHDFYSELDRNYSYLSVNFIIVDNNSTDNSKKLLETLVQNNTGRVEVASCSVQGYGAALKTGYALASNYQYISFLDLDNTYPLQSLFSMVKLIESEDLDIVYGARLHSESKISLIRGFGNKLYVGLLRLLLRSTLTDVCSGMRMFKSSKLPEILNLSDNGLSFSIQFSTYAIAQKWKIKEIPIHYRDRLGESKLVVLNDGIKFLISSLKTSLLSKKVK